MQPTWVQVLVAWGARGAAMVGVQDLAAWRARGTASWWMHSVTTWVDVLLWMMSLAVARSNCASPRGVGGPGHCKLGGGMNSSTMGLLDDFIYEKSHVAASPTSCAKDLEKSFHLLGKTDLLKCLIPDFLKSSIPQFLNSLILSNLIQFLNILIPT